MNSIKKLIEQHNSMTIATSGNQGSAAAAVFYAPSEDNRTLIFVSNSKSEHIKNSVVNPNCAATIHKDEMNWEEIRGLQIKGKIEPAEKEHWEFYFKKFPYIKQNENLMRALEKVNLYAFKIKWIRIIDNKRGFGAKEEFTY